MATLDDLRKLGYDVGLAHGSVQTELDALAAAKEAADPGTIADQANTVVADTVVALTTLGKLDALDETERLQMFAQMGETAFQTLATASTERVAFHERALAIAQESPDVWHFAGPGVSGYVSCKEDGTGWDADQQAVLDALADPTAFAERSFQVDNPEAMQAAQQIAAGGVEIVRAPGAETWEAEGKTYTAADLPAFLADVQKRPPLPTTAEKVATAIAAAPEISAATKAALAAALADSK
jgi:hypothetical protein